LYRISYTKIPYCNSKPADDDPSAWMPITDELIERYYYWDFAGSDFRLTFRVCTTFSLERPTGEARIHAVVRWNEPLLFSDNQHLIIFCCEFIIS